MSTPSDHFLTRRRLLGAAGSAAAVSLATSGVVDAQEEQEEANPPRMQRQRAERNAPVETIPVTNTGYEYYTYSFAAFLPRQSSNGRATDDLGATITSGLMDMFAAVTLPVGTAVREMTSSMAGLATIPFTATVAMTA